MRILELSLKNFRCFEAYTLRLASRFSLLIGENGSGKTVMLDALAVAAGSFLLGIPAAMARPINKDEIRAVYPLVGQTSTREKVGETEVSARGEIEDLTLEWKRSLHSEQARTTRQHSNKIQTAAERLVRRAKEGAPTTFPVLAFHGTGRLWKTLNGSKVETTGIGSRYLGYVGMAADIAYRMATLNPHLLERVITETPGIVLIDEIDLHLHPNWQRQVVGHLPRAFPQVQFVATTHSLLSSSRCTDWRARFCGT